jgi:hypothetical protein
MALPLACVLLLATAAATFAEAEKEFREFNFAITPPVGWSKMPQAISKPGLCAAFGSPDKTGLFLVLRNDIEPPPGELDDRFVTQFENTTEETGGGKRLSGKFVFVQGIKSYERTGTPVVKGKTMSVLSRTIPVRGHFYDLQGFRWDGRNAAGDKEIRAVMDSFRFLAPPPLALAEPAAPKRDADLKASYQRGQDTPKVLPALFVFLFVVGGIVFVVARIGNMHSQRRLLEPQSPPFPPPAPPPLPTGSPPPLPGATPGNQAQGSPSRSPIIRPREWRPRW